MRFFIVGRAEAGRPVGACLSARLSLSRAAVRRLLAAQQVRVNGKPCLDPNWRLQRGQRVQVRLSDAPQKRDKTSPARLPHGPRPTIRYADKHLVVVDKPAGLTTMRHAEEAAEFGSRGKRFLPPTLADLLPDLLARRSPQERTPVRAVHRLDKETSGLVVFARTVEAERHLGRQFRAHTIERQYLAVVRGRAKNARIESWLVRDRGDGRRGSAPTPGEGQRAVTHVRVLEELGDYTLVECRLETGRTHQVRIHLGEAGTPLCGERLYDRPLHGKPLPDDSGMKRVALHAALLGFEHPVTGEAMRWTSTLTRDMNDLVKRLRSRPPA
ncbi:MAG TPA: RluA family pseudouridine synthase [Gemmataceae bacterium]|nr:RluA family pseudouridine synthase [Gemmataceae bacterium]